MHGGLLSQQTGIAASIMWMDTAAAFRFRDSGGFIDRAHDTLSTLDLSPARQLIRVPRGRCCE
ncbi:hypothetical protein FRUB_06818 [Fimbriiglobus ruber]|uniref:Uncharacterized protein n=1 Tax=Fimbriiglobus ruber TaxID=1908690 RepID=A0A225DGN5_9BACT|nr:hypothetical protein FRUB_06818 [Fimbriiglobus ruber]